MYQKLKKYFFLGIFCCILLAGCSGKANNTNNVEINAYEEKTTNTMQDSLVEESETSNTTHNNSFKDSEANIISINEIETEDILNLFAKNMFDPGEENFKEMSQEDVLEYFGIELDINSVLSNMYESPEQRYGFYEFPYGGIFAQQSFTYQSDEGQILKIIIRKNGLPIYAFTEAYLHEMETSTMYKQDIIIAHYINLDGADTYHAEMVNENMGTVIITEDLALDDFMSVIEYLVQIQQ